jgi:hypothetical protein
VSATIQRITYEEFLPALGVSLQRYEGYQKNVAVAITEEFANCAYRMHSMVRRGFVSRVCIIPQVDVLHGNILVA